jgi:uncharacterized protein (TIGR00251 family)
LKIDVKVIPNARKERIVDEDGLLKVYVTAPALDGKANKALIDLLAEHFDVKKRDVRIVKGEKSREKVVEII